MTTTAYTVSDSKVPDSQYLHLLRDVTFQPVFIIGPYRSGTTILHRFLYMTEGFNAVTPYHLLKYDELLSNHLLGSEQQAKDEIRALFASRGLNDRIFDGVKVSPDAPVEYAYIFRKLGLLPRIRPKTLPRFLEFGRKVQFVSDRAKPLLLKNPLDAGNFLYIKQALPNARFIFIHRHPLHVLNSQLKAARSVLATKNPFLALVEEYQQLFDRPVRLFIARLLTSARFDLGLRLLVPLMGRVTNYYLHNIGSIPGSDLVSIRYEDLCASPQETMDRIIRFLDLQPESEIDYRQLIAPRPMNLLPEVARNSAAIHKKLLPYYSYHGYNER